MRPLLRSEVPRWALWLMNALAIAALGWTAYCLYAWVTRSGIWRITWNLIASHQRGTPDSLAVMITSWGLGFTPLVVVFGPLLWWLRRRAKRAM
jgi:hypothetical protein